MDNPSIHGRQAYLTGLEPDQRSLFDGDELTPTDDLDASDEEADLELRDAEKREALRYLTARHAELLEPFEGWLGELFRVWFIGSEQDWARAAWEALGRQGVLGENAPDDYADLLDNAALLVTLSAINTRFSGIRNGDGEGCAWQWASPYVDRDNLEVSDIQIGRWAEQRGLGQNAYDPNEDLSKLLKEYAFELSGRVFSALFAEWGENVLFTSLWTVSDAEAVHPAPDRVVDQVMNDPDGAMVDTYTWFDHGRDI